MKLQLAFIVTASMVQYGGGISCYQQLSCSSAANSHDECADKLTTSENKPCTALGDKYCLYERSYNGDKYRSKFTCAKGTALESFGPINSCSENQNLQDSKFYHIKCLCDKDGCNGASWALPRPLLVALIALLAS